MEFIFNPNHHHLQIINYCAKEHSAKNPKFEHLPEAMIRHLKNTVSDHYWKRASEYMKVIQQTEKEKKLARLKEKAAHQQLIPPKPKAKPDKLPVPPIVQPSHITCATASVPVPNPVTIAPHKVPPAVSSIPGATRPPAKLPPPETSKASSKDSTAAGAAAIAAAAVATATANKKKEEAAAAVAQAKKEKGAAQKQARTLNKTKQKQLDDLKKANDKAQGVILEKEKKIKEALDENIKLKEDKKKMWEENTQLFKQLEELKKVLLVKETTIITKKKKKKPSTSSLFPDDTLGLDEPVYAEAMEALDGPVTCDFTAAADLLSAQHLPNIELDKEQEALLYGLPLPPKEERSEKQQPQKQAQQPKGKEELSLSVPPPPLLPQLTKPPNTMLADAEKLIGKTNKFHGWSQRNIVSAKAAWTRIRQANGKMLKVSGKDTNKLLPKWEGEEATGSDMLCTLLSEATQIFMRGVLEEAVSAARDRQNIDLMRIWHLQVSLMCSCFGPLLSLSCHKKSISLFLVPYAVFDYDMLAA
uniref:Uncharacterized protein n=1 Tax=Corethron hystrix TaxID=216773 RepID=A0A7S1FSE2_9STRA|mmetsp:Transcript_24868/g.57313  ORF Transcript_24868/g.57313 Transcript_24868/m.57313 type:complete len:529 (+) Transcript_24868:1485-3071(+)